MAVMVKNGNRGNAEVCHGDEACRDKFRVLLAEIGLPDVLLQTLDDLEECGYVRDTGYVWLKNKNKPDPYSFDSVVVRLETEITAYFRPKRIKNLTGVKARELLIWFSLSEIFVDNAAVITFKTLPGFSKSFPLSAFDSISVPDQTGENHVLQESSTENGKINYVY